MNGLGAKGRSASSCRCSFGACRMSAAGTSYQDLTGIRDTQESDLFNPASVRKTTRKWAERGACEPPAARSCKLVGMRALKIISVIVGVLLALAGVVSVASGGFVLGLDRLHSAPSGFFMTPSQTVGSNGFALTAPDINGQLAGEWERWGLSQARATMRVTGSSKLPAPVFIGVAPTARVSRYLAEVARDRITSIDRGGVGATMST